MALDISFLHFTTKASYTAERSRNESSGTLAIFDGYISFVDEGPTIYTRGKEYKCSVDKSLVENLIDSAGHATVSQLEGYLPLTGGTMSGSIKFSESVNNILSILTENGEQSLININDSNLWFGQNNTIINKTIIKVGSSGLEVVRPSESNTAIVYDSRNLTKLSQLQNDLNLDFVPNNTVGVAGGIATLDNNGLVPASQLPSFVDDVLEYNTLDDFPIPGETGKIYVAKDTNLSYRWGETQYVEISKSIALANTVTGNDTALTASRSDHNHNSTYVTLATEQVISGKKTFSTWDKAITLTGNTTTFLNARDHYTIDLAEPLIESGYTSLFGIKLANGNTAVLGGIGNSIGWGFYKSDRTINGVDWFWNYIQEDNLAYLNTNFKIRSYDITINSTRTEGLTINRNTAAAAGILFKNTGGNLGFVTFNNSLEFKVLDKLGEALLTINSSGNATFKGSVTATSFIGNASTATKLASAKTLWGQSFDGSGNITGSLSNVGSITPITHNTYDIGQSNNKFKAGYITWVSTGNRTTNTSAGNGTVLGSNGTISISTDGSSNPTIYFSKGTTYNADNFLRWNGTAIMSTSLLSTTARMKATSGFCVSQTDPNGYGYSLIDTDIAAAPVYGMFFGPTANYGTHGTVTANHAIYFSIDGTTNRGFIFRNSTTNKGVASIDNLGNFTANQVYKGVNFTTSDVRLKTNIKDVQRKQIYKSLNISPLRSWNYKKDGTFAIGRIAQDVRKVFPELVTERNGVLYIDKESLLELEVEALNLKVQQLTTKLNELTNEKFEWQ